MQTYDFSTLHTSIPYKLLKFRITALANNSFKKRDGNTRNKHVKLDRGRGTLFISGSGKNMYTADKICK